MDIITSTRDGGSVVLSKKELESLMYSYTETDKEYKEPRSKVSTPDLKAVIKVIKGGKMSKSVMKVSKPFNRDELEVEFKRVTLNIGSDASKWKSVEACVEFVPKLDEMLKSLNSEAEMEKGVDAAAAQLASCAYQAQNTFERCNELKHIWPHLSCDQKIKESHAYYDRVFRSKRHCNYIVEEIYVKKGRSRFGRCADRCDDHPFNARTVMRIIMEDWPEFMNNFEDYKHEFYKLTETLGTTKKQNQNVKVKSDKKGGIIVPQLIQDRYADFVFVHADTGDVIKGFPLDIPEWYHHGELKRLMK